VQQDRVDESGPVAVLAANGFGKPQQVPPTATGSVQPLAVVPTESAPCKRPMMLARAFGSACSMKRHVDLVEDVHSQRELARQQSSESRTRGGADHERDAAGSCPRFEVANSPHVVHVIRRRHDMMTVIDQRSDEIGLVRCGGDDHDRCRQRIEIGQVHDLCDAGMRSQSSANIAVAVEGQDMSSVVRELPRHSTADDSRPDDGNGLRSVGHDGGRVNSRHPPRWGGTPPLPRRRKPPATRAATMSAPRARLSIFTVGLTRIELVTSSLSGMRSNRLSYSPGVGEPYRSVTPGLNREPGSERRFCRDLRLRLLGLGRLL
jgi:hypothetical protein